VNKSRTSERLSGLLAFALSGLFYIAVVALVLLWTKNRPVFQPAFHPAPVNLSFAQIELKAAELPPEVKTEHPPPEKAEVAVELEPEPPPPEPIKAEAKVTQEASAPVVPPVDRNVLLDWVRTQIEKEKYYPPAARNAGFEGQFRLLIKIGPDGKISEAAVLDGKGHPMLRHSLEKIMIGLIGRDSGQPPPAPVELPFEFEFKLN
jgi:TonB family protein